MREEIPSKAAASSPAPHRLCARCSPGLYRRVNRSSLMERTLFTWLGLFPWECVSCRKKRFFRDSGRKSGAPTAGLRTS